MSTRADGLNVALGQNGYHDGQGYDETSKYAQFFGIQWGIAYCDIFVAWCFEQIGLPLPDMHSAGVAIKSGAQYVPDSYAYYSARGAIVNSWESQPFDQVLFSWDGQMGPNTHTELVDHYDAANGLLYTIGGNSGPSNVDGYQGTGGVHRHWWSCPQGVGNSLIYGVGNTSKVVSFGTSEELILTPEDKAFLVANFASKSDVSQLVKVFEDGAGHAFGMEGIKDVADEVTALRAQNSTILAQNAKIAAHLGVAL